MIINGWVCFLSKIELMVVMIFGAFSAITGKLRKLAASLFIFEVIINLGTILWGVVGTRVGTGSWKETWKLFKDSFDKPYGPQDYKEYEEAIDWRDSKIHALEEEREENLKHINLLRSDVQSLQKEYEKCVSELVGNDTKKHKRTTKKKEENLDKAFNV